MKNPMIKYKKKQKRIIKNIKVCRIRLHQIYTEISSLDSDAFDYFSKLHHKNVWKYQEKKVDTDSEYDSDATVDLDIDLPDLPSVNSDCELSFDSSFFDSDVESDNERCKKRRKLN